MLYRCTVYIHRYIQIYFIREVSILAAKQADVDLLSKRNIDNINS